MQYIYIYKLLHALFRRSMIFVCSRPGLLSGLISRDIYNSFPKLLHVKSPDLPEKINMTSFSFSEENYLFQKEKFIYNQIIMALALVGGKYVIILLYTSLKIHR